MTGFNLPPGCTTQHIDEAAGVNAICECCGRVAEDCICPECEICSETGNPDCYRVVECEGFDMDIRIGITPNMAKNYKRRACAKRLLAEIPALKFSREQLIGQAQLKQHRLLEQIQDHNEYMRWLQAALDEEIADKQEQ